MKSREKSILKRQLHTIRDIYTKDPVERGIRLALGNPQKGILTSNQETMNLSCPKSPQLLVESVESTSTPTISQTRGLFQLAILFFDHHCKRLLLPALVHQH